MDIAKLKELLDKEYGIKNEGDLKEAMEKSQGVNIGIFVTPVTVVQNGG